MVCRWYGAVWYEDAKDRAGMQCRYLGTKRCCGRPETFAVSQGYWSRKQQAALAPYSHELIAGSHMRLDTAYWG